MEMEEQEVLSWELNTKEEYRVKGSAIIFSTRPKLVAKVLSSNFEKSMRHKTIKDADELFDMNEALDIFKA